MSTFITTYDTAGTGVRLAVKDLIDMAGEVTTAGCRAVARTAEPATPVATRSTHCRLNPFTCMVEVDTLSPANPAARDTPLRNPTQWDGV